MPLFSIVTPTHRASWIPKAWRSVQGQTIDDWEWVIVLNGEVKVSDIPAEIIQDVRVVVISSDAVGIIGALKREGCIKAVGDYIVEFDHDDELSIDCLAKLKKVFETDQKPGFVYSDCETLKQGKPHVYPKNGGWSTRPGVFRSVNGDQEVLVTNQPDPFPQHYGKIYYAPNHVRAWRRDAYLAVGGHDPKLEICDDLDLIHKFYLAGQPFYHIQECLYRYNLHGDNTWSDANQAKINAKCFELYDLNIENLALRWCITNKLPAYDLGGGLNPAAGWIGVDMHSAPIIADLSKPWPWKDSSVGALRASDFIEHIKDPIHLMNEAYRVLVHGGLFLIDVPSTDGRGAFQDPTHVSFWNSNSFWYYTQSHVQKYIKHAKVNCRFQQVRIANYHPSDWHKLHQILYAKSHMAAVKTGPTLYGTHQI